MNRDMDIIRQILICTERGGSLSELGIDERVIAYHGLLMIEAGLILGAVHEGTYGGRKLPDRFIYHRLTWAGHDFLDAICEDTIWKKAKEQVLKPGASWTFEVLKQWAKHELLTRAGIPVV
jgi:hypothetical protein